MLQMELPRIRDIRSVCKVTQKARGQESLCGTYVPKPPLYRKSPAIARGNRLVMPKGTINQ